MLTPLAYNNAVARGNVHKSVQSISIGGDLYSPINNLANAIVKGGITIVVAAGSENVNARQSLLHPPQMSSLLPHLTSMMPEQAFRILARGWISLGLMLIFSVHTPLATSATTI
jgi:hypothetical protein